MFFSFLSNPHLQVGALACVFEMVHKRMEHPKKIALIRQLQLVEVLAAIPIDDSTSSSSASPTSASSAAVSKAAFKSTFFSSSTSSSTNSSNGNADSNDDDDDDDEDDFSCKVAALVHTLGLNIISALEKLPKLITDPAEAASSALNQQALAGMGETIHQCVSFSLHLRNYCLYLRNHCLYLFACDRFILIRSI
jgi:hypothetical protein